MTHNKHILTYGFAIFAMFFGSGNLVFPIMIGYDSGNSWFLGFLGLLLTGIILPFLGLFVIKLHRGNYYSFFNEAGNIAKIFIPFFTLSLLGSFGVVPRCITVAHGGISYLFPELSLLVFALIFSIISYILCLKDQVMLKILGKWMSPLLLTVLLILVIIGILNSAPVVTENTSNSAAFINGFLTGYQIMDLFAAFFFSSLIFNQIKELQVIHDDGILKFAIKASLLGSSLLAIIYLGFVFLGAHYSSLLVNIPPEHMLPAIVKHIMGDTATLFLATAMTLSCLTTAIALNNIYARYICTALGVNANKFPIILLITTFISFAISLLDFKVIVALLAPALEISYPGIIFLTIASICTKEHKAIKKYTFWGITFCMTLYYFFLEA